MQTRWPQFYEVVKKAHEGMHNGHDFPHAERVAFWGRKFALDEYGDGNIADQAELMAGCHNADRIIELRSEKDRALLKGLEAWAEMHGKNDAVSQAIDLVGQKITKEKPAEHATEDLIWSWLYYAHVSRDYEEIILEGVMGHNKKNDPNHSPAQKSMMDGDKAVNMALDVIIRSGQLNSGISAVDYLNFLSDPEANYRNPRSVLRDIYHCLEWVDPEIPFCFRTNLGWKVGQERAAELHRFIYVLEVQLGEDGIFSKQ